MLVRTAFLLAPAVFVAAALALPGAAHAQTVEITQGHLPRDLGSGQFKLDVAMVDVPESLHLRGQVDGSDPQQLLERRLQVFFPRPEALGTPLHYDEASALADSSMPLYLSFAAPPEEVQTRVGTWTYTYHLTIQEALPGALAMAICGLPDCGNPQLPVVIIAFLGTGTGGAPVAVLDPPVVLTQQE